MNAVVEQERPAVQGHDTQRLEGRDELFEAVPVVNEGLARDLTQQYLSYEELVAELPETNQPHELWEGKLIMSPTPSFFHQEIAFRLQRALFDFAEAHRLGKVIGAPIDMVLSPHQAVQPDIAFISKERLHIIQRVMMGSADLVVEITSTGGRTRDRIEKRDLYEQHGVKEYWIVDPESQTVEVLGLEKGEYRLHMRCVRGEVAGSKLLPGFEVAVDQLFGAPESADPQNPRTTPK